MGIEILALLLLLITDWKHLCLNFCSIIHTCIYHIRYYLLCSKQISFNSNSKASRFQEQRLTTSQRDRSNVGNISVTSGASPSCSSGLVRNGQSSWPMPSPHCNRQFSTNEEFVELARLMSWMAYFFVQLLRIIQEIRTSLLNSNRRRRKRCTLGNKGLKTISRHRFNLSLKNMLVL